MQGYGLPTKSPTGCRKGIKHAVCFMYYGGRDGSEERRPMHGGRRARSSTSR